MHLFINLTTEAAPRASKALRMARKFLTAGWDVTMLVAIDGVRLADANGPAADCPVTGKPLRAMLAAVAAEATVLIGKDCLGEAGLADATLVPGCRVSDMEILQERLKLPETRTLSY